MKFLLFFLFSVSAQAANLSQLAPINLTASGTRQALSGTSQKVTTVVINALAANTGVIYVGDVAVTAANGFPLQKGDTIVLKAEAGTYLDLSKIYFDGGTTNDDIKVSIGSQLDVKIVPKPL